MRPGKLALLGGILIVVACLGFLTVADDLRHVGEFFGVLAILLCGVSFLLAGLRPRWSTTVSLQWVPVGILAGAVAGALTDQVAWGVSFGLALGLLLARLRRASSGAT